MNFPSTGIKNAGVQYGALTIFNSVLKCSFSITHQATVTAGQANLIKQQEELERKAAELERKEQELRNQASNTGGK